MVLRAQFLRFERLYGRVVVVGGLFVSLLYQNIVSCTNRFENWRIHRERMSIEDFIIEDKRVPQLC